MKYIFTENAPAPVGPYSQAVAHNGILYCSGQIALDADTGKLRTDSIEAETQLVLDNLDAVLSRAGTSKRNVIKCSVFVADISKFDRINTVYESYFGTDKAPARELVQVAKLPKGVNIEISAIAALPSTAS